jgi:hypothetical protein
MKGFPKVLATKEDYEMIRTEFPKEEWLPKFKELLVGQNEWFFVKYLSNNEEGIEDETHKVITEENIGIEDSPSKKAQYEFRHNPNCLLERIGYTEEEVLSIIG